VPTNKQLPKRRIPIQIWDETHSLPGGASVNQTGARCTKCGYEVRVLGTGAAAETTCAKVLREECPLSEENDYGPGPGIWH
jgi:hypothetical protein